MGKIFVGAMKYFSILFFISIVLSQTGYEIAQRINNHPTPDDVKARQAMENQKIYIHLNRTINKSYQC